MKTVKSLLLGSAAGLVAVAGAQAADLPGKAPAKAVEYVQICSQYGAGFFFIPGTDTCIDIGGFVRIDFNFNSSGYAKPFQPGSGYGANGIYDRNDNLFSTRTRVVMDTDVRSQTEFGTLRAFARYGVQATTGVNLAATAQVAYLERAFIQFAGFTTGYTASFYDQFTGFGLHTSMHNSFRWTNLIAYTAQLGQGWSATLSIEDATSRRNNIWGVVNNVFVTPAAALDVPGAIVPTAQYGYAGQAMPEIVGNIRVDQAWGFAQLSAAVGEVRPSFATQGTFRTPDTEYRYAVGGGVSFNLPFLAAGSQFQIQANYAKGGVEYLGISGSPIGSNLGAASPVTGTNQAFFLPIADAVLDSTSGNLKLVDGWSVYAQLRHFWTPALRSAVYVGYTDINVPNFAPVFGAPAANTIAWAPGDLKVLSVGVNTVWSPVRNLDIGVELLYQRVDRELHFRTPAGGIVTPVATLNSNGVWARGTSREDDAWSGAIRIQRNW